MSILGWVIIVCWKTWHWKLSKSLPDGSGLNSKKTAIKNDNIERHIDVQSTKIMERFKKWVQWNWIFCEYLRWERRRTANEEKRLHKDHKSRNGVEFIMIGNITKTVMGFWPISDILKKLEKKRCKNLSLKKNYATNLELKYMPQDVTSLRQSSLSDALRSAFASVGRCPLRF